MRDVGRTRPSAAKAASGPAMGGPAGALCAERSVGWAGLLSWVSTVRARETKAYIIYMFFKDVIGICSVKWFGLLGAPM